MKSSRYGLYKLGYKRVTLEITKSSNRDNLEQIFKNFFSPDYFLKLENIK